jgi:DNA-binding response OmpR family regulator
MVPYKRGQLKAAGLTSFLHGNSLVRKGLADLDYRCILLAMPHGVSFGTFELDLTTGELRKRGIRVRLPRQSIEILRLLVEHPGELVGRDLV